MALKLTLEGLSLRNVDDEEGRWQYEGGQIIVGERAVGWYASTKRMVFGESAGKTIAALRMEMFFLPNHPLKNLILQGEHDFATDAGAGSVGSASYSRSSKIGRQFKRNGNIVTIA
jgi:hypothetical protein